MFQKKMVFVLTALVVLFVFVQKTGAAELAPETQSPSVVLMEASTGKIISEKEKSLRRSPASITKIMTLLLIFEELEKGSLSLEEEVVTSAHAKSMGGSQVFLEEGEKQTVETLIKCIVIASGNDASVAMAEHLAGSEEAFVQRMNEKAQKLHMENTHFEDCCGLTDSQDHYTTAEDVAIMGRELIVRYPQVLQYSSVWMEEITHVTAKGSKPFMLTNTNKMIRSYEGCVGLKTGSTSKAGFCVCSVAERNDMTLIAVVMGADNYKVRFQDAAVLLDYGFGACRMYRDENQEILPRISVKQSLQKEASCRYASDFSYLLTGKEQEGKIEKKIRLPKSVKAPVKAGDRAGEAVYYLNGKKIGSVELVFEEAVPKADVLDYFLELLCHRWSFCDSSA